MVSNGSENEYNVIFLIVDNKGKTYKMIRDFLTFNALILLLK